jgi:hypothetical protein
MGAVERRLRALDKINVRWTRHGKLNGFGNERVAGEFVLMPPSVFGITHHNVIWAIAESCRLYYEVATFRQFS